MLQRFWRWLTLADARDDMAAVWAEVAVTEADLAKTSAKLAALIAAVGEFSWDADSRGRFREYLGRPEVQAELDEIIAATDKPLPAVIR